KRPEEVIALRRIYGPAFFLIAVFASEDDRLSFLTNDKNIPYDRAVRLMARDEAEKEEYGQRMRETFALADVFVDLNAKDFKDQLSHFLNLLFGHPRETPTKDENAMFIAYAASLRSASLSRQVGASITTKDDELVAIGCNDVPCFGGGLYWPGKDDQRDHVLKYD